MRVEMGILKGSTEIELAAGETVSLLVSTGGVRESFLPWLWSHYWRIEEVGRIR